MKYADVVLPLPVGESYTYSLPASFAEKVQAGCGVIVPFGSRKFYSAIVVDVHDNKPAYATKEVIELLYSRPILLPSQLRLWKWIADYYLCTLGEVYKAALPSGLKLESESIVVFNEDFEAESPFSPSEQKVYDQLCDKRELTISALQKATGIHSISSVVRSLLDKGALSMKEEMKRLCKPKTMHCVRLADSYFSETRLNEVLNAMGRSPKQQQLLLSYLDMAKASAALALHNATLLEEVPKTALLQATNSSYAIFNGLKEKGILEVYTKQVGRLPQQMLPAQMAMNPLSEAQQKAYEEVKEQFIHHDVCLLHGVTSSGKTELYIHLIADKLKEGKQVLYLLPEIVLTTQLTERLKRVFGDRLGVYHSKFPDAERAEVYEKMLSENPYDILVGVRSSVFLPFQRLGLVIVDEEHESSFKQQDPAPRYHARNVALVLASQMKAKTLLGTATPSVESYFNAQQNKYGLVKLHTRFRDVQLPRIEVVDMHELYRKKLIHGPFSPQLIKAMREALDAHQQIILFQNRRGYAPMVECNVCGWVARCQNCDISLTYHKGTSQMTCHYCGAVYRLPTSCPACESHDLYNHGYGTERIEATIQSVFPEARIARMDLDTTRSRQRYEQILDDFQQGRTDILVGTQMVTKGLDFDRVSLVGILDAGTMLNQPDFRSYERAFQMMSQVAGRAGRRQKQGLVILQSKDVSASVINQVVRHDYEGMYNDQLQERDIFSYPPYCRLVYANLKHRDEMVADHAATELVRVMRQVFGTRVLGPDKPVVSRVQLMHIRKVILKLEPTLSLADVRQRLRQIQRYMLDLPSFKSGQLYFDVDPL